MKHVRVPEEISHRLVKQIGETEDIVNEPGRVQPTSPKNQPTHDSHQPVHDSHQNASREADGKEAASPRIAEKGVVFVLAVEDIVSLMHAAPICHETGV